MRDDVQAFIDSVPADRRPLFDRLRALIEGLYPEARLTLSYGVPTFRTASGWVGLGYWKEGVSIYTNGRHNIAGFRAAHPRIRTGTGTINFRLTDDIPEDSLAEVIHGVMKGANPSPGDVSASLRGGRGARRGTRV